MLTISVPAVDLYDDATSTFISREAMTLDLEHSLVSLSKWEEIHKIPFLSDKPRTPEQTKSYIYCMIRTPGVEPEAIDYLSEENLQEINDYMNSPATATWFAERKNQPKPRSAETITSELVYYWLSAYTISWEAQHWHLNRLFTILRIASVKSEKPKKVGKAEAMAQQREENARRRAAMGTRG